MDYIYSRVSTDSQSTDPQLVELTRIFPHARVVSEIASGAKARPMLQSLVSRLTKEDRLIVSSLDRLGRRALEERETALSKNWTTKAKQFFMYKNQMVKLLGDRDILYLNTYLNVL